MAVCPQIVTSDLLWGFLNLPHVCFLVAYKAFICYKISVLLPQGVINL